MEILSLDVDTVLRAETEAPGSIIEHDKMTYVNLEFLCAILEQTIEANMENDTNQAHDKVAVIMVMDGLMTVMDWAPKLLGIKSFRKQLEEL